MPEIYSFGDTIQLGKNGEHIINSWLAKWKNIDYIEDVSNDQRYQQEDIDIIIHYKDGKVKYGEIKTDSYVSPNVFFETSSSSCDDGCMLKTKCDFLFYYFIKEDCLMLFKMPDYKEWFLNNKSVGTYRTVSNKTYTTKGYLIPKKVVEDKEFFLGYYYGLKSTKEV